MIYSLGGVYMRRFLREASLILTALMIIALLTGFTILTQRAQAQKTGPATDYVIYKSVPVDEVPEAIGKIIDVYIYSLRPEQIKALEGRTDVTLYAAPAGITDYDVNPAPVHMVTLDGVYTKEEVAKKFGVPVAAITYFEVNETAGTTYVEFGAFPGKGINPFAFREVRFALNYLIDREFIVTNIYGGYAAPMYTCYSFYDPMYSLIADIVAKYKFTYAPSLANELITKTLTAVGAVKEGGKWYYDGKEIKIKFVIRTEDERKDLGDMLATELERLGFVVDRMYMEFGEAISIVMASDPKELRWHLYTAGWGKGALDKWDPWPLAQFHAPWFGYVVGYGVPEWWNYRNATIDELTMALALGKFKSKEEFIEKSRKAVEIALQEAVRIWIATSMDVYTAIADLKGVTLDLGAGLRTIFGAREWYIPGNDTIRVGHRWVWSARTVWNPFGGFDDVYSVDIERQTWDPFIWRHPFNGEPIPFRVTYDVVTAGPEGVLDVPTDAIWWDAVNDRWIHVKPGTNATSKVVFDLSKLIGTKWHHNITITWADVLGYWAEWIDICYDPDKSQLESSIASANKAFFDIIKGIRILPDEKKLEVYIDYWHFDKAYIADMATLSLINPIELVLVQDYLAFTAKTYALDETRSRAEKIPQLNLVLAEHAKDVRAIAEKWLSEGYFPSNYFTVDGESYMTPDEWKARLNALIRWIDTYNSAWISNGPFKVVVFDKDKQIVKLKAFRDPTYPFTPGTWYFGLPRPVKIVSVGVPVVSPGESATIVITVTGEPPITVKYILRDPVTNKIIASGDAEQIGPTTFQVILPPEVTAELKEYSAYELITIAFSEKVAMPHEVDKTLTTGAAIGKRLGEISERVEEISKSMSAKIAEISSRVEEVSKTLGEALTASMTELGDTLKASLSELGETLKGPLTAVSEDITTVKNTVTGITSKLDELSGKVSEVSESVKGLSGAVTALEAILIVVLILQIIIIALVFRRR